MIIYLTIVVHELNTHTHTTHTKKLNKITKQNKNTIKQ